MDNDIKLLGSVTQLLNALDIRKSPEVYANKLLSITKEKSEPNKIPAFTLVNEIAESLPVSARDNFIAAYEHLRPQQLRELDQFVQLLHKIHKDPEVASALNIKKVNPTSADTTTISNARTTVYDTTYATNSTTPPQLSSRNSRQKLGSRSSFENSNVTPKGRSQSFQETVDGTTVFPSTVGNITRLSNTGMESKILGSGGRSVLVESPSVSVRNQIPSVVKETDAEDLRNYSEAEQEGLLIEDLLFVLMGIDGKYIRKVYAQSLNEDELTDEFTFYINENFSQSLKELAAQILPIAQYYQTVEVFIETNNTSEVGQVNNALSSTMKTILKEYFVLIAQLEYQFHSTPNFSVQKLWFYLHPILNSMYALTKLIKNIKNADNVIPLDDVRAGKLKRGGGVVLSVISNEMLNNSGDPSIKEMYTNLLLKSTVPYFSMLKTWIHQGVIDQDISDEFMVIEKRGMTTEQLRTDFNDVYWEQRYTIREDSVPEFLRPYKEKILLAGKYVNVIKECGLVVEESSLVKKGEEDEFESKEFDLKRFVKEIDEAYKFANQRLLTVMFDEHQLIQRLRSIKHFFFLYQSDFLTPFMDLVRPQLIKPKSEISIDKLRRSFELVIRNSASVSGCDPYKDDVVVELSNHSLSQMLLRIISVVGYNQRGSESDAGLVGTPGVLTGFDAIMLGYTVRFPLSLVINKKALTKYQLLFRHLFTCKHIESLLSMAWRDQGKSRLYRSAPQRFTKAGSKSNEPTGTLKTANEREKEKEQMEESLFMARVCSLRTKMMNFVQQFLYYECLEVLEPNWDALERRLKSVSTVDEVLKYHNDFLDTCLKECMLTNPRLLKIFTAMLETCTIFCEFSGWYTRLRSPKPGSTTESQLLSRSTRTTTTYQTNTYIQDDFELSLDSWWDTDDSSKPKTGAEMTNNTVGRATGLKVSPASVVTETGRKNTLAEIEKRFMEQMRSFLDALNFFSATETVTLGDLVTRLDYNLYFEKEAVVGGNGVSVGF